MKRSLEASLADMERLADELLEKKLRGEGCEEWGRGLGVLMGLREPPAALREAVAAAEASRGAGDEKRLSSQETAALNGELRTQVRGAAAAEEETGGGGGVAELYEALHTIRTLESDLVRLRAAKMDVSAQKRELAGQLAQITGNVPALNLKLSKEGKKHIHLIDETPLPSSPDLPIPLYVLQQSLEMMDVDTATEDTDAGLRNVMHARSLRVRLSWPSKPDFEMVFSYCPSLDVVAVAGDHSILQLEQDDNGKSSPSLTSIYRVGAAEASRLVAEMDPARPYRWCQFICGLQAAKSVDDLSRTPMTMAQIAELIGGRRV